MGLRSPQEMQKVAIKPQGTTRFSGLRAPLVDKDFLTTYSQALDLHESRRLKQIEFVKAQIGNDADGDVIEAQGKLSSAQGLNALKTSKQQEAELQKKFDARLAKIPEDFRPYAAQVVQSKLNKYNRFATPYTAGQAKKVEDDTYTLQVANESNNAIENSGDMEYLDSEGILRVKDAIVKSSANRGLSPEQAEYNVNLGVSSVVRRSVEQQAKIGPDGLTRANELAKLHNDKLLPADRIKVLNALRTAEKDLGTREAIVLADIAYEQAAGNPAMADQFIRDNAKNTSVARQSSIMLNNRLRNEKAAKTKQIEDATADVYEAVEKGQDPNSLIQNIPWPYREKVLESLNKNQGMTNRLTDTASYETLLERFRNNPTAAANTKLGGFKGLLSPRDYRTFEKWQTNLKKSQTDEVARAQLGNDDEVQKSISRFLTAKGVRGKQARAQATSFAYARYMQLLEENPKSTRKQIREVLDRELNENGVKEVEVKNKLTLGLFWNKSKNAPNPDLVKPDTTPTVDPSWINAIRESNPQATESYINRTIEILRSKGVDVSTARR